MKFYKIIPIVFFCSSVFGCPEVDSKFEPVLSKENKHLCRTEYEIEYSEKNKLAVWVGERLTAKEVNHSETRLNQFKADPDIKKGVRAELYDYVGSHMDRGHLAPAGDMATIEGMLESFYLSNMIPQTPGNNRGIWKMLENYVRSLALQRGEIIVFTGPIIGKAFRTIGVNKIPVPRAMFKIIYDPVTFESRSFIIPNERILAGSLYQYSKTLAEIEKQTNLKFLKDVPVKEQILNY